jgi:hypothetical protein
LLRSITLAPAAGDGMGRDRMTATADTKRITFGGYKLSTIFAATTLSIHHTMNDIVKLLPDGISDFEVMMTENYAYVDKTRFIKMLEKEPNPYHFFIRPRKFGKSLFFSILYNYYCLNKAQQFQ